MSKMTAALFMIIAVILMLVAPESTIAQDKQVLGLAVLDLQAIGISETEALSLSEVLRSGISRVLTEQKKKIDAEYKLLERSQMEKILDEFKVQSTGCTDVECAVEFGKMFAVDRIIIGSIGLVGSTYTIIARIVDVETGSILSIVNRKQRGEIDSIIDLMPLIGHELLTGERLAGPASPDISDSVTKTQTTDKDDVSALGIIMVRIPAGSHIMGSNDGEDDEKPIHNVQLDEFLMSATEVTQGQYGVVWEYACRAGTNTTYYLGDNEIVLSRSGMSADPLIVMSQSLAIRI